MQLCAVLPSILHNFSPCLHIQLSVIRRVCCVVNFFEGSQEVLKSVRCVCTDRPLHAARDQNFRLMVMKALEIDDELADE